MDSNKYTWNGLLSEVQLEKVTNLVDILKVVKNNLLNYNFINKHKDPPLKPIMYNPNDQNRINLTHKYRK